MGHYQNFSFQFILKAGFPANATHATHAT